MYNRNLYKFRNSKEYEYMWLGRYGAPGEKRRKRQKATPEQVRKQNQFNRVKKVRRLIKANFTSRDYWCTLKYPKGVRPPVETVKKDLKKFLRRMRSKYKKHKQDFKYVYRMEIGRRGGIHIHVLLNRIRGTPQTDIIVRDCWKHAGSINFQLLYEAGGYEELAEYIVKMPDDEQMQQLSLFDDSEQKKLCSYNHSRNLIIPRPEKKKYMRWTMKKIVENGPAASKGYYIDKNSIRMGVNQYTGKSYLYYTEYLIEPRGGG